ncbi:LOW QUALITY PROTEIN: hypothetical protein Dda_0108 [Drechslerella dactyloides]|uniref:Short-chain dehydrogenase n=1 Tax=Drechslerella dactyloides TaxID=74499 RepID=A0AAD6J628_DREDA|nr:LOW QUALITY PROTEIN: hypothetical protein Dda_0108 [Drechslerella dactyloides]
MRWRNFQRGPQKTYVLTPRASKTSTQYEAIGVRTSEYTASNSGETVRLHDYQSSCRINLSTVALDAKPTIRMSSNASWDVSTTSDEVAAAFSSHIKDKTVLVTGISPDGLGLDFCRAIAGHSPKLIILAARNPSKIAAAQEYLLSLHPSVALKPLVLDLCSLRSVRAAAADINQTVPCVDVLVNNAAMHAKELMRTEDGLETSFSTNHIGHFLLANLLLKEGGAMSSGGRVVNVTSNSFRRGGILWDDPSFLKTPFGEGWAAYQQSKTANVLFSAALAERFGDRKVYSYSLHPGEADLIITVINTAMAKKMDMDDFEKRFNVAIHWKTFAQGTATHVVAAFDPAIESHNGAFLTDCQIKPIPGPEAEWATGKENTERLWKLSEEIVGEKF